MLPYRPPRSQVWGHRVRRRSAVLLHDAAVRFLAERTHIIQSNGPLFSIGWVPTRSPEITPLVDGVRSLIASTPFGSKFTNCRGDSGTEWRWTVAPGEVRSLAEWVDAVRREAPPDDLWVTLNHTTVFRWNDAAGEVGTTTGGMFGVHLGRPRAVTTQFSFESNAHYRAVKAYLSEIGLVDLSDRNLRPAPMPRRGRR